MPRNRSTRVAEVVVLTTAMLTFISFWRAAAVVLCDMGSTVFYVGGIAEHVIGKSAPWFVLAVMLFGGLVAMVYVEGSSMFVRGGVYRVVREAFGPQLAKVSVSALLFDYILTGPISAVSAGHYLAGLLNSLAPRMNIGWHVDGDSFSVAFALAVTVWFWRRNLKGIEESSEDSLRIMQLMTFTCSILILWSLVTVYLRRPSLPPFELHLQPHALGWLEPYSALHAIPLIGILVAFGHSILGMSGLESMAQVYREVEAPKLLNLKRTALIVFSFALVVTGFLSLFSVMLIPDEVRPQYAENLLSGLAMWLSGPEWARLAFQGLVVVTGAFILSGAVNTAIVGASSVLSRVAEDGILTDWFRHLHPVYGTNYRMIHMVAILQIVTILLCQGNVFYLGEAYAFGVVWSFFFKSLSLIVLRFRHPKNREWIVPGNISWGQVKVPVLLSLVFFVLAASALANLATKKISTISGLASTIFFFGLFELSERLNKSRRVGHKEKLNTRHEQELDQAFNNLSKTRRVVVACRNPENLYHLEWVLAENDDETTDILVVYSKVSKGVALAGQQAKMGHEEETLFSKVIEVAEKHGQKVHPILLVSNDPAYAVAQAAQSCGAQEVVLGPSTRWGVETQLERFAMAWGSLFEREGGQRPLKVRIVGPGRGELTYNLG